MKVTKRRLKEIISEELTKVQKDKKKKLKDKKKKLEKELDDLKHQ